MLLIRGIAILQGLLDFVLTHASQLLTCGNPDAAVCLSAAQTISQVCEVAEGNDMAIQDATLNGLLHLIQQAAHAEVSLADRTACVADSIKRSHLTTSDVDDGQMLHAC